MDENQVALFPIDEVEQSVAARFESQAKKFAKRTALSAKSGDYTYDDVNRWANKIAHAVARYGSAPTRVAIYLDKDAQYIAAILGILKAGHAYVPIDPAFPRERNAYIVDDAQATLVLTSSAYRSSVEDLGVETAAIIDLDALDGDLSDANLELEISPDALAYIIYTSGSTGKPKGVMQNNRNTLHGCMRRTNLQAITCEDRMSLFYSCSVMGSVYCIFGALLNGASLLPYDIREEGLSELADWLVSNGVTIYHSVASVFRKFAATYDGAIEGSCVRLVIFGGERVLTSDVIASRRVFTNNVRFFTGLGSTETGTIRHFLIGPETNVSGRIVPIGYPVEGVDIVLTDETGNPVPDGEIGEINVHSRYIALGYWNNPEASSKVFADVPGRPGVRCYRMGDMAQLQEGGLLEHRGRKDFQVKIRGFRVEIGEVASALQLYPEIAEGVVKAQEIGDETQLVAYVTARKQSSPDALHVGELRSFLRAKLPSYMVPTIYVGLDAIPKTPNGKVDRNALPLPLPSNQLPEESCVAAETATEETLLRICAELLRRPEVGANQNFFDLGGDSLTATQLVSRVHQLLHVKLSMRSVFAADNLKTLAATIDGTSAAADAGVATHIAKVSRGSKLPATPAQKRMWLLDQLSNGTSAYNISNTVRLRGSLNVVAMEKSLSEMLARHDVLRTVFTADEKGVWQEVREHAPVKLPVTDLREYPVEQREQLALERVRTALGKPADLASGPLFEHELIIVDDADFILSLVFNHIVYDNIWSSRIFFNELGTLYKFYSTRGTTTDESPLTPLNFQFADYAQWEVNRIEHDAFEAQLNYWREQLSNPPKALEVPSDRLRPAKPTFNGGQVAFSVPAYVRLALTQYSRSESATIFMAMLAAWQLLLSRYSGQDDVLVGTPTGRRHHPETEGMIGLFINNLVMRAQFDENMTFRELLQQVRQISIDAFSNDELPFERLVAELRPDRTSGASPFFQHFFIHRNATNAGWQIPGLDLEPVKEHQGGSKFDLTLSVLEDEHQISGTIEYSADLFDHDTIERLSENYVQLLSAALDHPDEPVVTLEIVAQSERTKLLEAWNPPSSPYPSEECTHQLFEKQVRQAKDAVAVISDSGTLSYEELNARANTLATRLQSLGVGPDSLVAVCVNRSADLIIALLGVMKSGAAYVPLDPDFPSERLTYMIEDSRAKVFVTESGIAPRFSHVEAEQVLIEQWNSPSDTAPSSAGRPADLAYVIYTSGSTGKPKGVQITHQSLVNFLWAMKEEPGLDPGDVLQSLTTVCFDIAALELFLPLVVGARVVISDRETSLSPDRLIQSLRDHSVTVVQATPITWRMLLDNGWTAEPKIKILCGGEAMGLDLAERLVQTGCEIWNVYGPTETTIWSTAGRVRAKVDSTFVGNPIANTQLFVTNQSLALQPIGVPGELLIGGDGLARGYLGRAELTAERFVSSELGSTKRLYRTGDLVVRNADGLLEFLGRIDNQVKIRGFRIELGDIEAHLAEHSGVGHNVVVAREDTPGEKRLVAYCVTAGTAGGTSEELHRHLKEKLPQYMLPSAYVFLDALPKTPNGKIDRKALPVPSQSVSTDDAAAATDARHDLDLALLAVWRSVLGRNDISIDDDFFTAGGDSMKAISLVKQMHKATGVEFPLANLFESPTIRGLIESGGEETERAAAIVKLNQVESGVPVYCLAGVQMYKPLAVQFSDSPVFGVFAKRELTGIQERSDGHVVRLPMDSLVETYADALANHCDGDELALVGISFGGLLALEVASALRRRGYIVSHVVLLDSIPRTAYGRSLRKALQDCGQRFVKDGPVTAIGDISRRAYKTLSEGAFSPNRRTRHTVSSRKESTQAAAFREMRDSYDPRGKRYDFDALLIKATEKELGIGATMKADYALGEIVHGKLRIEEVPANHIDMLTGNIAKRVFEIVSDYMRSH